MLLFICSERDKGLVGPDNVDVTGVGLCLYSGDRGAGRMVETTLDCDWAPAVCLSVCLSVGLSLIGTAYRN